MSRALLALLLCTPLLLLAQEKSSPEESARMAKEIERLEGEIQDSINEYNKRPRRVFVKPSVQDEVIKDYVRELLKKIERLGTESYPSEARGKLYGAAIVQFEIFPDGAIQNVMVVKSSGHEVLDNAAKQAVKSASPAQPFSQLIKAQTDILVVTRTFEFTKGIGEQ